MNTLVMSFVAPPADAQHSDSDPAKVIIVVPRARAYLADLLIKAFEGRQDVEIVVERRHGERRTQWQSVEMERRGGSERRRRKVEIIQVVVGGISGPERPHDRP